MRMTGVDIAIVQEKKIVDPTFANHFFEGFSVLAATENSK